MNGHCIEGLDGPRDQAGIADRARRARARAVLLLAVDDVAVRAAWQPGLDGDGLVRRQVVVERRPSAGALAQRYHLGVIGVEVMALGIPDVLVPTNHADDPRIAVVAGPCRAAAVGVADETCGVRGRRVVAGGPLEAGGDLRRAVALSKQPLVGEDETVTVLVSEVFARVAV